MFEENKSESKKLARVILGFVFAVGCIFALAVVSKGSSASSEGNLESDNLEITPSK